MKKIKSLIKIILSILSISCLVYIFVIDDYVGLFDRMTPDANHTEPDTTAEDSGITLNVPSDSLYYENVENFNFLQDVTATDANGNDITSQVKYTVKAGDSIENKKIEYYITSGGVVVCSAERSFIISDYAGPSITITPDVIVHATEAQDLVNTLINLGALSATDGLGNNITQAVTFDSNTPLNTAGKYPVRFTVTNSFNDTYSLLYEIEITGSTTDPVIALTTSTVTLPLGTEFNWRNYLDYASDPVDGDISHRIRVKNDIDMWVPGVYTVTYTAVNSQGVSSEPAKLTVIIEGNQ